MALIEVQNLSISFTTQKGVITPVRDISFKLEKGESLGVVGESGSGKSLTNLAIMGLLPENALVRAEKMTFNGEDLLSLTDKKWQKIRGEKMAMIFQDPMTALNPCYTIRYQIEETLKAHTSLRSTNLLNRCLELLNLVGIPDPSSRLNTYPHELSGGMAQRVMIAIALACNPQILIADEPTTALDVTIQEQILRLIKDIQEKNNMGLILVTHDIGVVSEYTDRLQVMYAGEIVELGKTKEVIEAPFHPYTKGLLSSRPSEGHKFRAFLPSISGLVTDMRYRLEGCQFHPRCLKKEQDCLQSIPLNTYGSSKRPVRCIHPEIAKGHL